MANRFSRFFKGAETDRLTGLWSSTPVPVDSVIQQQQRTLVARSREQCANNDYGKRFLQVLRQNVIGHQGVVMQAHVRDSDGSLDTQANRAIEKAWSDWGEKQNCDVTEQQSWRAIQEMLVADAARDGEFFVQLVESDSEGGPYGVRLRRLDPQRCPPDVSQDLANGKYISAGIERNKMGRPIAYLFETKTPHKDYYQFGGQAFVRIPASKIIHGYIKEFPHQSRGLPWTTASVWRMKNIQGLEDSALQNAKISSAKGGFFYWDEGFGPDINSEEEELYLEAEPGTFQELPQGARFEAWDPSYPAASWEAFHKALLRGISAGLGIQYATLTNDLAEVSYSALRHGALDERAFYKTLQQWVVEQLCKPVFGVWLDNAILHNMVVHPVTGSPLPVRKLPKLKSVSWQPRRWQWVDPRNEADANIKMKNNLLASPLDIIREQGHDPETVYEDVAKAVDLMKEKGIPDEIINAMWGSVGQVYDTELNSTENNTEEGATDE